MWVMRGHSCSIGTRGGNTHLKKERNCGSKCREGWIRKRDPASPRVACPASPISWQGASAPAGQAVLQYGPDRDCRAERQSRPAHTHCLLSKHDLCRRSCPAWRAGPVAGRRHAEATPTRSPGGGRARPTPHHCRLPPHPCALRAENGPQVNTSFPTALRNVWHPSPSRRSWPAICPGHRARRRHQKRVLLRWRVPALTPVGVPEPLSAVLLLVREAINRRAEGAWVLLNAGRDRGTAALRGPRRCRVGLRSRHAESHGVCRYQAMAQTRRGGVRVSRDAQDPNGTKRALGML
jgi:hypothetical protein